MEKSVLSGVLVMTKFITIITATYNAASTLPRLLESLASQTCRDFELIIQDGASNDNTVEIAESYRDMLPALSIVSEPDTGIYDAWNKALSRINGRWTLFLGADDSLYTTDILDKVRNMLGLLSSDESAHIRFAAGSVVVTTAERIPLRYISGRVEGAVNSLRAAAIPTPFPGLFIRSELFGNHLFRSDLRIVGDYEFLCQTWNEDKQGIRLPYLVTAMTTGGISEQQSHAAMCAKETYDAAHRHFGNAWTPEHKRHYFCTRILSTLYSWLPQVAPQIHNALRRLRNRPPLICQGRHSPALTPFAPESVPIFIISYNRLRCLKRLISWLEENGNTNIIVVDNSSTYPPLLEYLDSLSYRVIRLNENKGYLAVWECGVFSDILDKQYFVVTDPDVLPSETCPDDAIMCFYNKLMEYPHITKCGFSLLIDDIPSDYPLRQSVVSLEKRYWEAPLPDGSGYVAPIDTTFALYRPGIAPNDPRWLSAIRLAPPYAARHLPWYESAANDDEESVFYRKVCKAQSSYWTATDADSLKQENLALRRRIEELEAQVDMMSQRFSNKVYILVYRMLRAVKKSILG